LKRVVSLRLGLLNHWGSSWAVSVPLQCVSIWEIVLATSLGT
jgi:hypothetical protein